MRQIIIDSSFKKRYKKFVKNNTKIADKIGKVLDILGKDLHHTSLFTHKLNGAMKDSYACSISYEARLVFYFDTENIYLLDIGNHDDVY